MTGPDSVRVYWTTLGVFERRTATGSELIEFLGGGFGQIFGQIFSIWAKILSNIIVIASRNVKREKALFLFYVRRFKTLGLKLLIRELKQQRF